MNMKFWRKKDDLGLGDNGPKPSSSTALGLGDQTGLDFSRGFEPTQPAFGTTPGLPPLSQPSLFSQTPSNFAFQGGMQQQQDNHVFTPAGEEHSPDPSVTKDLELIAAKLDTIKAQLEMLNNRVANLELQKTPEQPQNPRKPWY